MASNDLDSAKEERLAPGIVVVHDDSHLGHDIWLQLDQQAAPTGPWRQQWHLAAAGITFLSALLLLFLSSAVGQVWSLSINASSCQSPTLRQEWRTLPIETRRDYVRAVQCLSLRPSQLGLETSRYDDFVFVHLQAANNTHGVAISLPWHRFYIQQYENSLRNECGYKGYLAYWDWTLDATDPENSPVWSMTSGFGGNGSAPDGCVETGPMAMLQPQYPTQHCLRRAFALDGMHGLNFTTNKVDDLFQNTTTYHGFRQGLEDGPHRYVHRGIGGEMPTPHSTNDPIFFLHHAQIDRLWWKWQNMSPLERISAYDAVPQDVTSQGFEGDNGVTLKDMILMHDLAEDVQVQDVMSTKTSLLCYRYPNA